MNGSYYMQEHFETEESKQTYDLLVSLTQKQLKAAFIKTITADGVIPVRKVLTAIAEKGYSRLDDYINDEWQRLERIDFTDEESETLTQLCRIIMADSTDKNLAHFQSKIKETNFNARTVLTDFIFRSCRNTSPKAEEPLYLVEFEIINDDMDEDDDDNKQYYMTLLSFSIWCQNFKISKFLLDYGWNFAQHEDETKNTIMSGQLYEAIMNDDEESALLLLEKGGEQLLKVKLDEHLTCLQLALLYSRKIFKKLLSVYPDNFKLLQTLAGGPSITATVASKLELITLNELLELGYNDHAYKYYDLEEKKEYTLTPLLTMMSSLNTSTTTQETIYILLVMTHLLLLGSVSNFNDIIPKYLEKLSSINDSIKNCTTEEDYQIAKLALICLTIFKQSAAFKYIEEKSKKKIQPVLEIAKQLNHKIVRTPPVETTLKDRCLSLVKHSIIFQSAGSYVNTVLIDDLKNMLSVQIKDCAFSFKALMVQLFSTLCLSEKVPLKLKALKINHLLHNMKIFHPEDFAQFITNLKTPDIEEVNEESFTHNLKL